jgi:hypothetical protein
MMIYNPAIENRDADLSKIAAHYDGYNVTYWDSLTKNMAKTMWKQAMLDIFKYSRNEAGFNNAINVLACLEDNYPAWVEEFELG